MEKFSYWVFILGFVGTHLTPSKLAAAQLKNLRLAFSALVDANPRFWIAHELKLFEKYGLESELVYIGGSRPIQAMLGGSVG
jgi:ABC-type nitrate/sulfonate/bicarbonate transport system substrate-binding protein